MRRAAAPSADSSDALDLGEPGFLYTGAQPESPAASPSKDNVYAHTFCALRAGGAVTSPRSGYGRGQSTPDANREEPFRLVEIEPARAPEGCTGRDWYIYRIAQGSNMITGYRQGDLRATTAEVERIVVSLNERRIGGKGRPGPKPKSSAGPAASATPPDGDGGDS